MLGVLIIALAVPAGGYGQDALEIAFPALRFERPVDLQHAGDGSNRLFVVEQAGRVLVFDNEEEAATTRTFLDIRSRVNSSGNEEGLLGLAFHPEYDSNGSFFVYYTARGLTSCSSVQSNRCSVVSRFFVDANDPDAANEDSEEVVLVVEQPFSNHNAGQIRFGPDGFLYIALGDGGSGGDPLGHGQDLTTLLGSFLRIDVDTLQGGRNYGIPPDNPFAGTSFREEIYAYGFRNPWRFSFDPETGDFWVGDVGQNRFEEVNVVRIGGNYGWNEMEGTECFPAGSSCDKSGLELPVWTYQHGSSTGRSITGGFVYRGTRVPELAGAYLYADFVSGNLWALQSDGQGGFTNRLYSATGLPISAFGVDQEYELYVCTFQGRIYRLTMSINTGAASERPDGPSDLLTAFPNPVSSRSNIVMTLPSSSQVTLVVVDLLGRAVDSVLDRHLEAGEHRVSFDTNHLAPGTYFYVLDTAIGSEVEVLTVR